MAENNIGRLLDWFRSSGGKTIHIHHHSHQKDSPFTAGLPGAVVQPFAEPAPGEAVYVKYVNSSFIGTGLEDDLRRDGTHFFGEVFLRDVGQHGEVEGIDELFVNFDLELLVGPLLFVDTVSRISGRNQKRLGLH